LSQLKYLETNGVPCEGGEEAEYCVPTSNDIAYTIEFPFECLDSGYQARKKAYSQGVRNCLKITEKQQEVVSAQPDGKTLTYAQMCPPNPYAYFKKCSPGDNSCRYIASGCVDCDANGENCDCSAADPYQVLSCHNDLTDCKDKEYIKDYNMWMSFNDRCKANWDQWEALNPAATTYSAIFYAVLLIVIIVLFSVARRKTLNADGSPVEDRGLIGKAKDKLFGKKDDAAEPVEAKVV
jgi:hypothetical protein